MTQALFLTKHGLIGLGSGHSDCSGGVLKHYTSTSITLHKALKGIATQEVVNLLI
jgi:hypothetical protein